MALSTLVGLVWVLFVSAVVRGWAGDHTWLPVWVFILGIAYVVLRLLEYLAFVSYKVPTLQRRSKPAEPAV